MDKHTYKLTPINRYWYNEFFSEMILWRVRKKVVVQGDSILTRYPEVVDVAMEIFGDNIIEVEHVDA